MQHEGMDIALQQCGQCLMHQPVSLQQSLSGKLLRHDQEPEVPLAAATDMPGVGGAIVANLQPHGVKRILHHRADPFNPGALTRTQALRRCSQRAWPMASAASAMVRPKTLK